MNTKLQLNIANSQLNRSLKALNSLLLNMVQSESGEYSYLNPDQLDSHPEQHIKIPIITEEEYEDLCNLSNMIQMAAENKSEENTFKDLTFGHALDAIKRGGRAARAGWNGKNMFIFMRPGYVSDANEIQLFPSVHEAVKFYFLGKRSVNKEKPVEAVVFTPYLCMKAADDSIVNGWLASQTDMLAEDWEILS